MAATDIVKKSVYLLSLITLACGIGSYYIKSRLPAASIATVPAPAPVASSAPTPTSYPPAVAIPANSGRAAVSKDEINTAQIFTGNEIDSEINNYTYTCWGKLKDATDEQKMDCFIEAMKQFGASPQAIQFTREFGNQGYMVEFQEAGKVDLISIMEPLLANENLRQCLVNGKPRFVQVGQDNNFQRIAEKDIQANQYFKKLKRKHPEAVLWDIADEVVKVEKTESGGQRFIFKFPINECHCAGIAEAYIAYLFDAEGNFLNTKLMKVTPPDPD